MQYQDVLPALEYRAPLKEFTVASPPPTAARPPVTRRGVPAIPAMVIGLVVTAVLLAIVDAARADSASHVGEGRATPTLGQQASSNTDLCAAFDDAQEYFYRQNPITSAAGLNAISYFVDVARRHPDQSIQWDARDIGSAASSGTISIDTWHAYTGHVLRTCR